VERFSDPVSLSAFYGLCALCDCAAKMCFVGVFAGPDRCFVVPIDVRFVLCVVLLGVSKGSTILQRLLSGWVTMRSAPGTLDCFPEVRYDAPPTGTRKGDVASIQRPFQAATELVPE
jgi:hypothetical protein